MAEKLSGHSTSKNGSPFSWFEVILISALLLSVSTYSILSQYSSIFSESPSANRFFILNVKSTFENKSPQGNIWNLSEAEKTVGLFMNNTWQTVYLLNASYSVEVIQTDDDGNPVASLSFPISKIPSGENLTYQIAYRIILKPRSLPLISEDQSGTLNEINEELKERYCGANGLWQVEREELRDLAFKIAGNETNVLSLLKKFILWIKQNVYYETRDLPKYPMETIKDKAGDCDDQANLLIAFCRIIGIPAYLQVGCIYLPQRNFEKIYWDGHWILNLTRIGWHGWAMVYVPPWGWIPVDLTYASGILSDPMNAMRKAAVINFPVVQYANIIKTDYIASSRSYREFLRSNGFKIYEYDVMLEEIEEHPERRNFRLPCFYKFVCLSISSLKTLEVTFIREDPIGEIANAYKMVFISYLHAACMRGCSSWLNSKL